MDNVVAVDVVACVGSTAVFGCSRWITASTVSRMNIHWYLMEKCV
jgi:hypothetical protein